MLERERDRAAVRRLKGCFAYNFDVLTTLPSRFARHLPLHRGGSSVPLHRIKTTFRERAGWWARRRAFIDRIRGNQILSRGAHSYTVSKQLFVSILGGGTKMLAAVPFRLFAN